MKKVNDSYSFSKSFKKWWKTRQVILVFFFFFYVFSKMIEKCVIALMFVVFQTNKLTIDIENLRKSIARKPDNVAGKCTVHQ